MTPTRALSRAGRLEYKSEGYFYNGMIAFTQLMTVVVVVFGAIAITGAALDLSDLITFLLYVGILIEPIERLVNFARWYQEGITGFNRLMDILELPPAIQDSAHAHAPARVRGQLELQNVSFAYRADFGAVLRDLSLTIGVGEYVALVGVSGVGKVGR